MGEHRLRLREPVQAQSHLTQPQVQPESPGANHASADRSAAAWLQLAGRLGAMTTLERVRWEVRLTPRHHLLPSAPRLQSRHDMV